mmetsp:Transcript_14701/g.37139  ORF Transcript_14701/g.37139 Transcript_14701/m.37139 type:complete len:915 (-) Transcript_14701:189-2933(-)
MVQGTASPRDSSVSRARDSLDDPVDQDIRDGARLALQRPASDVDKVGPMTLRWSTPPIVEHMSPRLANGFLFPIRPGGRLVRLDHVDIKLQDREDVLLLLKNYQGNMGVEPGGGVEVDGGAEMRSLLHGPDPTLLDFLVRMEDGQVDSEMLDIVEVLSRERGVDTSAMEGGLSGFLTKCVTFSEEIRQAAKDALRTQCEYDKIGPFAFSWNPCKLVAVEEYAAALFEMRIRKGDELAAVGGTWCRGLSREDILQLLVQYPESLIFARGWGLDHRQAIVEAARQALLDDAVPAGPEWVGPLRIWWRKPATVVEVAKHAQTESERSAPVGSYFVTIDGHSVVQAERQEILQRLQLHKELEMEDDGLASSFLAGAYLAQFKQAEDPEWIGPFRVSWSSPCPTLREVDPDFFQSIRPIPKDGDILAGCSGVSFAWCSRSRILEIICDSDGKLHLQPRHVWQLQQAAAALLTTQPVLPVNDDVPALEWVGSLLLAWTQPPTIVDVLPQAGQMFAVMPSPGDDIETVGGKLAEGMTRRQVLEAMKTDGLALRRTGVRGQIRAAAALLLTETGPGAQADWLGPVKLGWHTKPPLVMNVKPEASKHMDIPLAQGDQLVEVAGQPVHHLDRRGILKLLVGPGFTVRFQSLNDRGDAETQPLNYASRPQSEWVGKFRLLWSKPPTVIQSLAGANDGYQQPIVAGDVVVAVDGVPVATSGREDVRKLMTLEPGKLSLAPSFEGKVRAGAFLALEAPATDPEWVGPFQFRWTVPPSLVKVAPDAQGHFSDTLTSGEVLESVDGCKWDRGDRDEVLRRLANFHDGLSFATSGSFDHEVRVAARACLESADTDVNQLGPMTVQWTDPPTVLWIAESAQGKFNRRVEHGDRLVGADGQMFNSLSRRKILKVLAEFDGNMTIFPAECPVM